MVKKSAVCFAFLLALSGLLHAEPVPVVITIDDGLRTGLTIMAPALERRGWRGTYNIVTDNIGKPALLTWRDVRELVRRGHAVTTHTKSHANLGKLAQAGKTDAVRAEIADSAERIAAETGIRPHYLCLPWGSGGPTVDAVAASCGLETFAVRREVCGKCSPAGTDKGPRARIERRIAAGDRAVDLMIHGVTPVGGGYEAFETVADFEAFLDEVAACTNVVVVDYRTAQDAVRRKAPAPARIETVVRADHTNALYRCGETAAFSVAVSDGAALMRTGTVSVVLDDFGTNVLAKRTFDLAQGNPVVVTGARATPGFLRLKVSGMGEPKAWGVGYEPERIRAVTRIPDGFDAFWAEARRKLAAEVPLDPQVAKVSERCTADFDFYRISFATFGRRVYGYMSVPTDATRSPFPLELQISAAGFGDWSNDMAGEPDRIRVFFGVYPFEPDWKWRTSGLKARYGAMDKALRERYACSSYATAGAGVSREECFFYPVVLGIDRAVDWLAARPDVDRGRIRCQGASQGAGLGMAVTALNKNISRAAFAVPALTDTLAGQAGRQSGWPQPVESQRRAEAKKVAARVMPFFDATCFATRITCPVRFAVGFADTTCPPHCTYAAFNALASKDMALVYGVGMGHTCWPRYSKALSDWLRE